MNYALPMSIHDQNTLMHNYLYAVELCTNLVNKANDNENMTAIIVDEFINQETKKLNIKITIN